MTYKIVQLIFIIFFFFFFEFQFKIPTKTNSNLDETPSKYNYTLIMIFYYIVYKLDFISYELYLTKNIAKLLKLLPNNFKFNHNSKLYPQYKFF